MWWLLIPAVGIVGKLIYDSAVEDNSPPSMQKKTVLESNLERLKTELRSEMGRKVAIIGQPGAGKSSLLKKMTGGKVVPLPVIGNHTDATNWSTDVSCNLLSRYNGKVFSDVPGYDTQTHPVNVFKSNFPFWDFDAFLFVVHGKLHGSDEDIFQIASRTGKPVFIARSFLDSLDQDDLKLSEGDIRKKLSVSPSVKFFFFSNRTGEGVDAIFRAVAHG